MTTTLPPRLLLQQISRDAMQARGFEAEYPAAVVYEVAHLPRTIPAADGVRDLRHLLWASIDNDDSRDLDQLSAADAMSDGSTRILVAVAEVDALVGKGSAIDQHAGLNTTSVYTVGQVFAMLPERLSTDLTSLVEGRDRLALVIDLVIAADASVVASDIYPAVVRNRARLAYSSVGPWLEGDGPVPEAIAAVAGLEAKLRLQDAVAIALRRARHLHGALTLDTVEARPVFEGDRLQDLALDRPNRAKELIEDFMIAANVATAQFLSARKYPSLRRVVQQPKRWDRIVSLAAQTGTRLPAEPDASAMETWLVAQRLSGPEQFSDLSLSVVKLLGRGEYVVQYPDRPPIGHFGLAVHDYTHATAPNRRFADLVTQRIAKAAIAQRLSPYGEGALDAVARRCTEREDAANKVERQVRKSAAAILLSSRIGATFDAVVTGVSPKGTWVRAKTPPVEGRLQRGFEGVDVGDPVRVRLLSTDVHRGFIDFERA